MVLDVRKLGDLSPLERREIELEENLRRKDLTPAERSRLMVEQIEASKAIAKAEVEAGKKPVRNSDKKRGPTKSAGSVRDVEERTQIKRDAQHKAKKHVTAFDRYPFLEGPQWNQSGATEAFRHLEEMPDEDRPRGFRRSLTTGVRDWQNADVKPNAKSYVKPIAKK